MRARPNGDERANGSAAGEGASLEQIDYIRSLASEAGYTTAQLDYLAEEVVGERKPLRSLTKAEASAVIETLRGE